MIYCFFSPSGQLKMRRRREEEEEDVILPPRKEVRTMNLVHFDEHIKKVENLRPLTTYEMEYVKNARRCLKNKAYARESRIRKKEYATSLEITIDDLQDELETAKETIHRLKVENMMLKSENTKLQEKIPSSRLSYTEYTSPEIIWHDDNIPLSPLYDDELMIIDHPSNT